MYRIVHALSQKRIVSTRAITRSNHDGDSPNPVELITETGATKSRPCNQCNLDKAKASPVRPESSMDRGEQTI